MFRKTGRSGNRAQEISPNQSDRLSRDNYGNRLINQPIRNYELIKSSTDPKPTTDGPKIINSTNNQPEMNCWQKLGPPKPSGKIFEDQISKKGYEERQNQLWRQQAEKRQLINLADPPRPKLLNFGQYAKMASVNKPNFNHFLSHGNETESEKPKTKEYLAHPEGKWPTTDDQIPVKGRPSKPSWLDSEKLYKNSLTNPADVTDMSIMTEQMIKPVRKLIETVIIDDDDDESDSEINDKLKWHEIYGVRQLDNYEIWFGLNNEQREAYLEFQDTQIDDRSDSFDGDKVENQTPTRETPSSGGSSPTYPIAGWSSAESLSPSKPADYGTPVGSPSCLNQSTEDWYRERNREQKDSPKPPASPLMFHGRPIAECLSPRITSPRTRLSTTSESGQNSPEREPKSPLYSPFFSESATK